MWKFFVEHWEGIAGALGGMFTGILGWKEFQKRRKTAEVEQKLANKKLTIEHRSDREDMANEHLLSAINIFKEEANRLRERVVTLEHKVLNMTDSFQDLSTKLLEEKELRVRTQLQLSIFMQAHLYLPLPMAVKDEESRMVSVNQAYYQVFLKQRGIELHDYTGMTDIDIWGEEIGELYQKHDRTALIEGFWHGKERTPVQGENREDEWIYFKFRLEENGKITGIGFIAVPDFTSDVNPTTVLRKYGII